jgi:pimeloyl-ACP methyl ester carboxylesterase
MKKYPTLFFFLYCLLQAVCFARPLVAQQMGGSTTLTMPRDSMFTSFDGTRIYFETEGKGKPVILIHGFINNSTNWKKSPLYQDLIHAGFRVIVLDLRGNGKSDHPHELAAYQNDAEARDVIGLAKFLKLSSYSVVGYSRGAIIASRVLVLDPKVRSGVLGGMGTGFTDPEWPRRKRFYQAFKGEGEMPEEAKGAVEYAKSIGADLIALAQMQGAQPATSPQELRNIRKPVLVIAGEQDKDNGSAKELADMLGKATYESVSGGNHNNTIMLPPFSNAVIRFLKKN